MKRPVGILSTAMAGLFAAAMAFAAEPTQHSEHMGKSGSTSRGGTFMGEHEMTGTVTDVDKDEGRVSIDSEGQKLDLHFPASALRNVNKGDRVTVRLGIREGGMAAGTSMRGGTHREPGTGTSGRTESGTR